MTSVNLDEYKGLSGDNDQSYRYFMDHNLFDHVNIDKARTFVPDGLEEDSDKACAQYNEIIRQTGGVDMQLLGIGGNGHIGFNEPGDAFEKETAQEVGEEDDLFAQEDHEEVEPVSKADNTDEDFSWIEEAYGSEDGTDEAEGLGDETDEDESFDDEEDDGDYEAQIDDDSEAPHRRTLTIRAGYVPHAVKARQ